MPTRPSGPDATWPAVPAEVKDLLVETLMRVTVSHVVARLHGPDEVARSLAELTRRLMGWARRPAPAGLRRTCA
ncbi:hypothetical protein [Actinomadura napierensis]|uniref:hypothetical protein n=1 Tax=Actinomadura napierensis TaxID=267854 RepID=UPI0031DCC079